MTVNENQTMQPARASRSLWVLLGVCASALLIIVFTMAGDLSDARSLQTAHATTPAACNMSVTDLQRLPLRLQPAMQDDCATPR
jgi:hypothetical protein